MACKHQDPVHAWVAGRLKGTRRHAHRPPSPLHAVAAPQGPTWLASIGSERPPPCKRGGRQVKHVGFYPKQHQEEAVLPWQLSSVRRRLQQCSRPPAAPRR